MFIVFQIIFLVLSSLSFESIVPSVYAGQLDYINVQLTNENKNYSVKKDFKDRRKILFFKIDKKKKESLLGTYQVQEGNLQSADVLVHKNKVLFITIWSAGAHSEIIRIFQKGHSFSKPLFEKRSSQALSYKDLTKNNKVSIQIEFTEMDLSSQEPKEISKKETWTSP